MEFENMYLLEPRESRVRFISSYAELVIVLIPIPIGNEFHKLVSVFLV